MKKFLSIVISILMISAMMSVVAFADTATISMDAITGLVAGESVVLEPTVAAGTTYTVSVNNQVFGLENGTANGSITSVEVIAPATATLTVNSSVPATFTSAIKLQVAGEEAVMVNVSVADRLLGDFNGDGAVNSIDAAYILAFEATQEKEATHKIVAADVDKNGAANSIDAAQILVYEADATLSDIQGMNAYIGGNNTSLVIVDPFAVVTPDPVALTAPAHLYAYYQDGKLYYTFDAVANASSYTITVGAETFANISTTSGSLTLTNTWDGTGTLAVTAVAVGDGENYTNSPATSPVNAVYANVSGQLSAWLATNGLSDVAITVYEITE